MDTKSVDWREDKSLYDCLLYMLESENICDVTFIVGADKTRISAHKTVLASRSAVFHTMFNGSLPEKGDVVVPDIDEKTFREILRFIYSDEKSITECNVKELLYASDKYMLTALKKACDKELKRIATTKHAAKALESAYQYGLTELLKESLNYIENHCKDCLSSIHASALPKECVEFLLKNEFLDCTETDICRFFFEWMRKQCAVKGVEANSKNIRELAGNLLFLIRFPVVEMKYFSAEIVPIDVLLPDEVIDIYRSHFENKVLSSKKFITFPRGPFRKRQENHAKIEGNVENLSTYEGVHALSFKSNASIWMKSITVFTPKAKPQPYQSQSSSQTRYEIQLTIVNNNGEVQTSMPVKIYTSFIDIKICLNEPMFVSAEEDYTVILTFPTIHFPHGFEMKQILYCSNICEDPKTGVKLEFKTSPKSTLVTNSDRGIFKSFSFSV